MSTQPVATVPDTPAPRGGLPAGMPSVEVVDARTSLRHQVAEVMRGLLVSGQLQPGTLYSVPRLAAQFGVSATPVREALLDLAHEGLLEAVRNKGFRVTAVDDRTLDELAELRALIEVPAMVAVAGARDGAVDSGVESLRPLARRIVAAAAAGDLAAYVLVDTEFHLAFLALHGNDHLVDVVRDLRGRSRLSGLPALVDAGVLETQAHEHEQMVDAALAHDRVLMRRLVTQHLGHVRTSWAGHREPVAARG